MKLLFGAFCASLIAAPLAFADCGDCKKECEKECKKDESTLIAGKCGKECDGEKDEETMA